MQKIHLILNGKSASRPDVREAVHQVRSSGVEVDVYVTWEGGDAGRFAQKAVACGSGVVVAGGGDGTVNEVLNGLMASGQHATLAILPLGTANDFATSAAVPVASPLDALLLAAHGRATPMDVGLVNGRHIMNVASGGFGAEVTEQTSEHLKHLIGGGAYALSAAVMALSEHPYSGRLITPEQVFEGSMVMMAVGNGRQAGGGALLTPQACIDDGLFDVMVVPHHDKNRLGHLLSDLLQLKHGQSEHFRYFRTGSVRVESQQQLQFNLDGEPLRGTAFDFSVVPRAIDFVFPDHSPLLSSGEGRALDHSNPDRYTP